VRGPLLLPLQVDRIFKRVPGAAFWQHTQRRSGRRKWPDTRAVPRQAGLLPRLGNVLGELRRRAPLPGLATERHVRRQRRVVRRVRSTLHLLHPPHLLMSHNHLPFSRWLIHSRRASKEEPSRKRHTIVKNGYNLGRDWFVERAVAGSHWKGHQVWWSARVEWRTGLLEPGNNGTSAALSFYPNPPLFFFSFLLLSSIISDLICVLLATARRQPRHPTGRACRRPHRIPGLVPPPPHPPSVLSTRETRHDTTFQRPLMKTFCEHVDLWERHLVDRVRSLFLAHRLSIIMHYVSLSTDEQRGRSTPCDCK
jgi:hypothetical protein